MLLTTANRSTFCSLVFSMASAASFTSVEFAVVDPRLLRGLVFQEQIADDEESKDEQSPPAIFREEIDEGDGVGQDFGPHWSR